MALEEGPSGSRLAVLVTGAGLEEANGLFRPAREWHGAPVFENDAGGLLSREPHKNSATGETRYGWILGRDRKPLYAVQSDELAPPPQGWKLFRGTAPVPSVQGVMATDGALKAAQYFKDCGNTCFSQHQYEAADSHWTRALNCCAQHPDRTEALRVALHSNRAEARLRLKRWHEALRDAEAVLEARPTHDKALLRAAVAARELNMLDEAMSFAQTCLEHHSQHAEASKLLNELQRIVDRDRSPAEFRPRKAQFQVAEDKPNTQDSLHREMFKGTKGYGQMREPGEAPPLKNLPYHKMGLPQEQVDLMDSFFKEMREKKATLNQQAEDSALPAANDTRTAAAGLSRALPTLAARKDAVDSSQLDEAEVAEIDGLFKAFPMKKKDASSEPVSALRDSRETERQQRIEAAKRTLQGKTAASAASDARNRHEMLQASLKRLAERRGEPTRFEQAGGEVYAWWKLPDDVKASDIQVHVSDGGNHLTVTISGTPIFDQQLFLQIQGDDVVWTVSDSELQLTLTKAVRNKLWEQLSRVAEVQHDADGNAIPESLPEPLSAKERVDKFQQILQGDDGEEMCFDDLDPQQKYIVNLIRKYRHAKATGDNAELAEAEAELSELGPLVV